MQSGSWERDQRDAKLAYRSNTSRHAMISSPSVPSVFDSSVKLSQAVLAPHNAFTRHGGQGLRERISFSLSLTSSLSSQTRCRCSPIVQRLPRSSHRCRSGVSSENVVKRSRLTQRRDYFQIPRERFSQFRFDHVSVHSTPSFSCVWFETDVLHAPAVAVRSTKIHLNVCESGASPQALQQAISELAPVRLLSASSSDVRRLYGYERRSHPLVPLVQVRLRSLAQITHREA